MLPVIAIVGAPNVGKSTLFNRLTRTRDALVADEPGVTRDRHYGLATQGARRFALIDTGGVTDESAPIPDMIAKQAHQAMDEAHAIIFVVLCQMDVMRQFSLEQARPGLVGNKQTRHVRSRRTVAIGIGENPFDFDLFYSFVIVYN